MTVIFGYEKPGGIGTNVCKLNHDANRLENWGCNESCPFLIECKPFFGDLNKQIKELSKNLKEAE